MNLNDHKNTIAGKLRDATLCFLTKEDEILLAMKKRGFGKGRWNGAGGKVKNGENILAAMVRETEEEIAVTPKNFQKKAVLNFYFANKPEFNQCVHVFFCSRYSGEPRESEEMAPRWFNVSALPYEEMWPDDKYWLPETLAGKEIYAEFLFGNGDSVLDYHVKNELA